MPPRYHHRRTPFDTSTIALRPYCFGKAVLCGCEGPDHRWDCFTNKPTPFQALLDYSGFVLANAFVNAMEAWRQFYKATDWGRGAIFGAVLVVYMVIVAGVWR